MVQYLHFRILKFPLILCPYDLSSLRPDWPLINALMAANSLARRNILHWVHLGWWRKEVLLPGTTQYIQDYPHNENIHWPTIINYNIFSCSQFFTSLVSKHSTEPKKVHQNPVLPCCSLWPRAQVEGNLDFVRENEPSSLMEAWIVVFMLDGGIRRD